MLIYACVSGHGFGHGSRVAAVLTALHQRRPDWRLVLSTPLAPSFLQLAFGAVPFVQRPCRWDVGVIQADALGADAEATLAALGHLEQQLPAQIEAELHWIRAQREPVLVLGDVAPAASALASQLGAPLVWMANFGWDAIYRPMGGAFIAWADRALEAYRQGDAVIRCPFSMPMPWDVPATEVGLTPGRARHTPERLQQRLQLEAPRECTVLVGFGGLGLALEPALLQRWPQHQFLVSDRGLAGATNATLIPQDLRPLELMPLCGRILTKPGYSTFCEAMAAGIGIHLVRREGFAEAPVLEEALQQHGWHRLLSREQLERGDWQLDQPLLPPRGGPLPSDGAEQAAAVILATAQRTNAALPQ
ncbi:MAG: hypothetical protein FJ049_03335 [Cyanobacteria bacterium M_surface_7_m2_037]|nr:hypothetical protein [Cyanobacteria bacterium M_surface_7_m2_037]